MKKLSLSGSLVLYKPDLQIIEKTLLALQNAGEVAKRYFDLDLKITLVDNSDSIAEFKRIETWLNAFRLQVSSWIISLVCAPGNVGYGKGNNLVIASAKSDYHIVINPDLFVRPDVLFEALRFMEDNQEVGLLSPAVFGEDGRRQYLCKRHPTLLIMFLRSFSSRWIEQFFEPILFDFEMRGCNYDEKIDPLEYPTGCFMFFRTDPLQAIAGFDPDFFLHYEDADIGRRMQKVARVAYVPAVQIVHKWNRETHKSLRGKWMTVRSGMIYWRKWGGIFTSRPDKYFNRQISNTNTSQVPHDSGSGKSPRVLITGASGFIGQGLSKLLHSTGYQVIGAVRRKVYVEQTPGVQVLAMGDLTQATDWSSVLEGVESVVHLAARVHMMHEIAENPLQEFRTANVDLTLNLARQAATAGVKRFVFVSSIKVNGETTPFGQPFHADDVPNPTDPYGISKHEAEQALMELGSLTGMEIVIIRPVLVYGPGVKANFFNMIRWIKTGIPLPLGSVRNRRSLVALDNLTDLIARCLQSPAAANQVFLVSDGEDLSVTELLQETGKALGRHARLISIPVWLLKFVGRLFGREAVVERLSESLQVDISKNLTLLGWYPPYDVKTSLEKSVQSVHSK